MAILSDYRGEEQQRQQQQQQQQPQQRQTKAPKTFNATLDPSNPLGFLQSAFEFVSIECDFFHNDSSEKEVGCLARKMIEKHREEQEKKKKIEIEKQRDELEILKKKTEQEKQERLLLWLRLRLRLRKRLLSKRKRERKRKRKRQQKRKMKRNPNPNKGNGFDLHKYSWVQNLQELTVNVPVPFGTKSSSILCDIKKNHLKVGIKGQPLFIDGELWKTIKPDDSFWSLEDKKAISILLTKQDQLEWWRCLVKGDPLIDTQKIHPENSRLSDLEPEMRSTVEKMMGLNEGACSPQSITLYESQSTHRD
ncbi:hypothetical protein Cgig2_015974 [Carnegiea gigantea]|uniref:CS domain-containing protein n=1 Tax=Carnegiea gigantea TaxID=171969 RepID=A0A9Q1QKM6_9CARY|nr:hypothetical protein Cgig2_015974 [Carnegiea gigantea]